MPRKLRGPGWLLFERGLVLAPVILALGACAPALGGGALAAMVAIGALTSQCYDYVDVSVYDGQGRKTCAATVSATNGGDHFELKSCYYAPLSDGHWTLRAALPGYADTVSTVQVEHEKDCTRHVQSLELTLAAPGAPPNARASTVPGAPALPPPPPAPVLPAPAPTAPAATSGPAVAGAPANGEPASPLPAPSALPPSAPGIGVFPDQPPRPVPPK